MKSTSLIIGGILLVLNLLICMVISSYETFHVVVNSGVIIVNTVLLLVLGTLNVKDGFRYSLNLLFPIFALIEFFIICFSRSGVENNWGLVVVLLFLVLQVILLLGAKKMSDITNNG